MFSVNAINIDSIHNCCD